MQGQAQEQEGEEQAQEQEGEEGWWQGAFLEEDSTEEGDEEGDGEEEEEEENVEEEEEEEEDVEEEEEEGGEEEEEEEACSSGRHPDLSVPVYSNLPLTVRDAVWFFSSWKNKHNLGKVAMDELLKFLDKHILPSGHK